MKSLLREISLKESFFLGLIYDFFLWIFWLFPLVISFWLLINKNLLGGLILFVFLVYLFKRKEAFQTIPKEKEKISSDLCNYFNLEAKKILKKSYLKAETEKQNFYLIFLKEALKNKKIKKVFELLEINLKEFFIELKEMLKNTEFISCKEGLANLISLAFKEAFIKKEKEVSLKDLFLALLKTKASYLEKLFLHFGIKETDFGAAFQILEIKRKIKRETLTSLFKKPSFKIKIHYLNRAWTSKPTPFLDRFSIDFTSLARENLIGFMVGHQEEYSRLIDVLSREEKNNVLLEGREGAGKETLIAHLAKEIIEDKVPSKLFDKRVVKLILPWVFSGAQNVFEIERRVKIILSEALDAGNLILFIPEIQLLFGEDFSLADFFIPYLNSKLIFITAIDSLHFEKISQRKDFLTNFEIIRVKEISESEALQVLFLESILREKKFKIKISFEALKVCLKLSQLYNPFKLLPQRAVELLDESIKDALDKEKKEISSKEIYQIVRRKTKIPVGKIRLEEKDLFLKLENLISEKYVNQKQAVKACARVLREFRAQIKPKKGPIATFLFVGPTGVGKTYLAKILSETLFGDEKFLKRFDFSKYQTQEAVIKLLGSKEKNILGELSKVILKNPYCVLLFDEFEKANQKVLDLFLPIFDEGEIIDNLGYKLDFTNTLIIATSNANANFIVKALRNGKTIPEIEETFRAQLIQFFKPELLNRFSEIILFKSLSLEEIKKICQLQLKELKKELEMKGIEVSFTENTIRALIKEGYIKEFGARALKRTIEKRIRALIANWLIKTPAYFGKKIIIDFIKNNYQLKEIN